jgi:phosphatidylserine decarboxylase
MKVASDAWIPAALAAVPAFAALALGWTIVAVALLSLPLCVLLFFRDPDRKIPDAEHLLVSPADGVVIGIEPAPEEDAGDGPRTRVSIFLSLFNVHINRAPAACGVEAVSYHPGSFLPAFSDKASLRNEQNRLRLVQGRHRFEMVQIAGLVARRIVCRVRPGDKLERGQRIGLIKFGSRVDLYLPPTVELSVKVGDRVRGGSTLIGRFLDPEPLRG